MSSDIEHGPPNPFREGRNISSILQVNTSPAAHSPTEIESHKHLTPFSPNLQVTQEEESVAIRHLLESWMDRLQLISVLAIFFASLEATLLSITMPQDQGKTNLSAGLQITNVCLTSGLLLHILAAFVSFLGGFFLIRYRIKWAKVEQKTVIRTRKMRYPVGSSICTEDSLYPSPMAVERNESPINMPMPMPVPQMTGREHRPPAQSSWVYPGGRGQGPRNRRSKSTWFLTEYYPTLLTSYNTPTAEQCPRSGYHSIRLPLPTRLLSRFHTLSITLTLLGFLFSLIGIVMNAWERLPHIVGVVGTVITTTTLLTILWMMFIPDRYPEQEDISAI